MLDAQVLSAVTGVVFESTRSHPASRLEPGDVVLIVDNLLGDDDGAMTLLGLRKSTFYEKRKTYGIE